MRYRTDQTYPNTRVNPTKPQVYSAFTLRPFFENLFPLGVYFLFTLNLLLVSSVALKSEADLSFILPSYCLLFLSLVYSDYTCSVCFLGCTADRGLLSVSSLGFLWVYCESTVVNPESKPGFS